MPADDARDRKRTFWGAVLLAAFIGLGSTWMVMNKPPLYEANPLTGRVCRTLAVVWWSGHTFYYTAARGCAISWTFATVMGVAALILLALRH